MNAFLQVALTFHIQIFLKSEFAGVFSVVVVVIFIIVIIIILLLMCSLDSLAYLIKLLAN